MNEPNSSQRYVRCTSSGKSFNNRDATMLSYQIPSPASVLADLARPHLQYGVRQVISFQAPGTGPVYLNRTTRPEGIARSKDASFKELPSDTIYAWLDDLRSVAAPFNIGGLILRLETNAIGSLPDDPVGDYTPPSRLAEELVRTATLNWPHDTDTLGVEVSTCNYMEQAGPQLPRALSSSFRETLAPLQACLDEHMPIWIDKNGSWLTGVKNLRLTIQLRRPSAHERMEALRKSRLAAADQPDN